jgi:hypothetical protein
LAMLPARINIDSNRPFASRAARRKVLLIGALRYNK